jgi:hypothetical protein
VVTTGGEWQAFSEVYICEKFFSKIKGDQEQI